MDTLKEKALAYHRYPIPGKTEIVATKPYSTPEDLSLAYSPGVAYPCLEIKEHEDEAYTYTNKGNLVAVISNGTAVLGMGNIGASAAKPVMEGKALLFKIFAGIDSYDIEINESDPVRFSEAVAAISPTFGGINLEDIKSPECFEIEERVKAVTDIPVMHDDQHGTAIVTGAALINALKLQGKKASDVRVVVNGAGAAAIACTRLWISLGIKPENILMCDSKGVIRDSRTDLNSLKKEFSRDTKAETLADALRGADVFLGLSVANVMTPEMLMSMAERPIVFALANPDPEIAYDVAKATRKDMIFATGRSDYPNQINNVLGFPYIFRGALDTRATDINEQMKLAAAHAIAQLAREPVPRELARSYGLADISFGPEYILPKPFDKRLLTTVAPAVAKSAMESGAARMDIRDMDQYKRHLAALIGHNDNYIIDLLQHH
ncbi:MAG: hypothetical protein K2M79_07050 [Muribaculaceae bacterium]|nr:hypothetical protein [Muribaculaceae bacterium]